MSKEIGTAVGIGVLGLGLGYISYRLLTNGVSITKENFFDRKQKIKPTVLPRKDRRVDKVCKTTYEKITQVETQCFKGINTALRLGGRDVKKLTASLVAKWMISEEEMTDLVTLSDVLLKMRSHGILGPVNYQEVVTSILQDADLELNKKAEELLILLKDTVMDHIEEDIRQQRTVAQNSESRKIDIYVLYSESDFEKAKLCQENICRYASTSDIKVVLMDDMGHGQTIFEAFEQGMESSIYVFVLVTESFAADGLKRFLAGIGLSANLQRSNKLWRLVPVWVDPGINERGKCPLEFSVLQGLHYNRFLEDELDTNCFKNIDRLIKKGRKKIMEESLARATKEHE
ncbi:uncharacterized protein LOC132550980 [Ylistrum balloti]|uniref:uncharacterized protein LOC132550980 n=1 Tax=Ylistrum balloti TaxID=509963 RepID=UPI0029058F56|nr:uncharacterized protein LOC132550980 [Ylistrum balloti]